VLMTNPRCHAQLRSRIDMPVFPTALLTRLNTSAAWLDAATLTQVVSHAALFCVYIGLPPFCLFTKPRPGVFLLVAHRMTTLDSRCVCVCVWVCVCVSSGVEWLQATRVDAWALGCGAATQACTLATACHPARFVDECRRVGSHVVRYPRL